MVIQKLCKLGIDFLQSTVFCYSRAEQTIFVLILKCVKVKKICFLLRSAEYARTDQSVRYRKKIILIKIIAIDVSESKIYSFYSSMSEMWIVKSENRTTKRNQVTFLKCKRWLKLKLDMIFRTRNHIRPSSDQCQTKVSTGW